jgi:threonine/homoserine/homoserine lactone efflux protein
MTSVAGALAAYLAAASLLTITPGLDTALVLRLAATGAPRPAALAALGIATGCFAWAVLVALGLGALLAASQAAYAVLRSAGALYLLWVGYRLLRHPRREFVVHGPQDRHHRAAFATGALTNLLNPKVGVFYVSFLPQFVPRGASVTPFIMLLGAIHAVLGLLWFACLIAATRPITAFLMKPAVARTCDRLTGGVFIAFGLGLALESRRS